MCKLSSLINCAIKNTELLEAVDRQTCQVWRTFIFNINNTKRSVIIKSYKKEELPNIFRVYQFSLIS